MKFALIASVLMSLVAADSIVSITSPLAGTKLKAGQDVIISWVNPTVPTISQIVLAKGPSTALQPMTAIAQNVDAAAGHFTWKIPYEIENGAEYAFEFGTSPDLAFAGPFSIEGGVGGTLPPSNSSTPSSPPSSHPSSSAGAPTSAASSGAPAASKPASASPSSSAASPSVVSAKSVVALAVVLAVSQLF